MALRAKAPILTKQRFKALVYATPGAGKTHFCCSLPYTYYIDSEGVQSYRHFNKMIADNKGDIIELKDLSEMINEVTDLLSIPHQYKTLVIDSLSFPWGLLSNLEAERLMRKSNKDTEGTEFGANLAKAKRLTFHLGMLLSRLDMNVIVTAHEKSKFLKGEEIGKTYDVSEKMGHSLGTVMNMRLMGNSRKIFLDKSRYPELPTNQLIDFQNGYEVLKDLFGEEMFLDESKTENLATASQLEEMERLIKFLNISEENIQKLLIQAGSENLSEVNKDKMQNYINQLKMRLQGEAA